MRGGRALGLLTGLVILVALGCSGDDDAASPTTVGEAAEVDEGVLRVGLVGPISLDPLDALVSPSELVLMDLLYDTVADLAEIEGDQSGTTWTLEVGGETFSDGGAITAEDLKFSLERLAEPGDESLRGVRLELVDGYDDFVAGEADEIAGIQVLDEDTLEITTTESYHELPALLEGTLFAVLPAEALEEDPEDFFEVPVTSGSFEVAEVTEEGLRLERVGEGGEGVEMVEVTFFESSAVAYEAFEAGELDWSPVPRGEIEDAVDRYGDDHVAPFLAEIWLGMNLASDTFEDARLRRAIAHAIDREALVEEHFPGMAVLNGIIPDGVPGAQEDACGETCEHDPEEARRLVEAAYPDGDVPEVALDYNRDDLDEEAVEAIASDLEAVGIPVELRPRRLDEYRAFVVSGQQELFVFGWVGVGTTPDTYLAPLFLSTSGENLTALRESIVDAGIAAARATADRDDRMQWYRTVEEAVLGLVPIVPVAQVQSAVVVSDRVEGLVSGVDATFDVDLVSVGA